MNIELGCGDYKNPGFKGLDKRKGKNVDITDYSDIKDNSADIVISGQAFEHIKDLDKIVKEVKRILKPDGMVCIIAPSEGPMHAKPDYRRFSCEDVKGRTNLKKVMKAFKCLDCYQDPRNIWHDIVFIGTGEKPVTEKIKETK